MSVQLFSNAIKRLVFVFGCVFGPVLGQTAHAELPPILPLAEVKPGAEGFALTAGAGNVLERFPVRVLEIIREPGQTFPLILVKASGPFIEASGGIAAGMSGSPVYIGDKLIGAIAFGFSQADSSLGLLTPIETMLLGMPKSSAQASLPTTLMSTLAPPLLNIARIDGTQPDSAQTVWRHPKYGPITPLSTPLLVAGLEGRAGERLSKMFERYHLQAKQLPVSSQGASARPYTLTAGAPISSLLVTGDVNIGAVGTVTLVDGPRFLAFGHPFLSLNKGHYAAGPAYIATIVPSILESFKLAEITGTPFGIISSDKPYGIAGQSAPDAGMMPFELTLKLPERENHTRVGLAPIETLVGDLALNVALNSLDRELEGRVPGTATIRTTIEFANREPLQLYDRVASIDDLAFAAGERLGFPIALIANNPFQAPNLRRVRAEVEISPLQLTRIVKVEPESKTAKPGQTVGLNVRLQPYREKPFVRRIAITIPKEATGTLQLTVRGGLTPGPDQEQGIDAFDGLLTFEELVERLRNRSSGDLVLVETMLEEDSGKPTTLTRETMPTPTIGLVDVKIDIDTPK